MDKLIRQIAKFGVVGVVCFGIDYGTMIMLTELGDLDYLFSSGISFSVAVVVNYLLSMRFVFRSREGRNKAKECIAFAALSVTGLLLTEVLMWAGVEWIGFHYMLTKVAATGIVMSYNFVTRKVIFEAKGFFE